MSIIKFMQDKQNKETCLCPVCNLLNIYIPKIINAENEDVLESIVEQLIMQSGDVGRDKSFITGYEEGFADGYRKALEVDIEIKEQILEEIDGECNCTCDEDGCSCTVKFE